MAYYCEVCGHKGGHAYGCPEAPSERPVTHCKECGCDLYAGDHAYKIGGWWYCEDCCFYDEIEAPEDYEPDWDDIRKERLIRGED